MKGKKSGGSLPYLPDAKRENKPLKPNLAACFNC